MSHGVTSKTSVPANYEFSMYKLCCESKFQLKSEKKKSEMCAHCFILVVLKPLSAECHVIMDQSTEIVLDTPKVEFLWP